MAAATESELAPPSCCGGAAESTTKGGERQSWGAGRRWRERNGVAVATLTALSLYDYLHRPLLTHLHLNLDSAKGHVFALAKAVAAPAVACAATAAAAAAAGRFEAAHPAYVEGRPQPPLVVLGLMLIGRAGRVQQR